MQKAKIQTASIDDVLIDPANVRMHPERNRATIRASLTRFGPGRSIVVDGNNIVRAGNGTVEEARQAGFDEVLIVEPKPNQLVAVKRQDWSPSEATAYAIADNRAAEHATWDNAGLAETLRALQNESFDLATVGYSDDELQGLIDGLANDVLSDDGAIAPNEFPEKDESIETEFCCPKCGYAWSGKSA